MTVVDAKDRVAYWAAAYGVPVDLALAVAQRESGFQQSARGAAGEIGIMQLMPPTAAALGVNSYDAEANIEGGVRLLRDLRRHEEILRQCVRINQLENEADQVMREALGKLFANANANAIDVIKWKDLYEHLELATDKCEDVANVIETVLVKYS